MDGTLTAIPVRGFISYARGDNDAYDGIVDKLKFQLETKFKAETGRPLELFLDRESIGWGDDWRDDITRSIESGMLFIAVVSMNYFDSPNCREELMQFYNGAKALGVTELLLPVVIAGKDAISLDSPLEEVRIIAARQYVDLVEAYEAGFDSREWRRSIGSMVRSLQSSLDEAESAIADFEDRSASRGQVPEGGADGGFDIVEITALVDELGEQQKESLQAANDFVEAFTASFEDINTGTPSAAQRQARTIVAASKVAPVAKDFDAKAAKTKALAQDADTKMRRLFAAMEEFSQGDVVELRQQMKSTVAGLGLGQRDMQPLEDAIEMMRFMGLVSVSLKKSLDPGIRGIQSLRDALAIVGSWSALGEGS